MSCCSDSVHAHQAAVVCIRAKMSGLSPAYGTEMTWTTQIVVTHISKLTVGVSCLLRRPKAFGRKPRSAMPSSWNESLLISASN